MTKPQISSCVHLEDSCFPSTNDLDITSQSLAQFEWDIKVSVSYRTVGPVIKINHVNPLVVFRQYTVGPLGTQQTYRQKLDVWALWSQLSNFSDDLYFFQLILNG